MEITSYGVVSADETGTEIYGEFAHLYSWATRPGETWPCSTLARLDDIAVTFDARGDLVDIHARADGLSATDTDDLSSDELNAWTSDVLRAAGMNDNPAIREA